MILQFCINYWTLKISLVLFVDKQNIVTCPLGTLQLEVVFVPSQRTSWQEMVGQTKSNFLGLFPESEDQ